MGRILGPRGLTAKQLEQETQCKIMVRGKGSMRDKKKVSITQNIIKVKICQNTKYRVKIFEINCFDFSGRHESR